LVAGHLRGDDGIVQAVKMTLPDGYAPLAAMLGHIEDRIDHLQVTQASPTAHREAETAKAHRG